MLRATLRRWLASAMRSAQLGNRDDEASAIGQVLGNDQQFDLLYESVVAERFGLADSETPILDAIQRLIEMLIEYAPQIIEIVMVIISLFAEDE